MSSHVNNLLEPFLGLQLGSLQFFNSLAQLARLPDNVIDCRSDLNRIDRQSRIRIVSIGFSVSVFAFGGVFLSRCGHSSVVDGFRCVGGSNSGSRRGVLSFGWLDMRLDS